MGNSPTKRPIELAEKTGTCNLAKLGLTEFPPELSSLTKNLRTLDVSENKLDNLPSSIGTFKMMKSLNLANNRLGAIPNEIGQLTKIEVLQLNNNRLTQIPPVFSKFSHLRDIDLSHNFLKDLPSQLCGLKNINCINLSHNKLTAVSDVVGSIEAIELNFNQNQISRISEKVADCPRLKVLRVEENCLEVSAFTEHLLKDSQIALLAIDGNLFESKSLHHAPGYEQYMERYSATKKKFN